MSLDGPTRLVLFDIDGTLIDGHGAGGRAILRAILETYGVSGELGGYTFHGRTDPGIISDLVVLWGVTTERAQDLLPACLERYTTLLDAEVAAGHIEVLPGIRRLLTALNADERALVGLLTGNVEAGARTKLKPTGLWPLFKVGAYGSDAAYRPDLPAVAVARAEALSGRRFRGKEVVVVGDTPSDVECGRHLGVKTVAVATGRHTMDELTTCAPDHVFPDFSDWKAAYEAILA